MNNNKITKGKFDPTTFSVLSISTKLEKVNFLLNSDLYNKCISLKNIEVKISNVFSKTHCAHTQVSRFQFLFLSQTNENLFNKIIKTDQSIK